MEVPTTSQDPPAPKQEETTTNNDTIRRELMHRYGLESEEASSSTSTTTQQRSRIRNLPRDATQQLFMPTVFQHVTRSQAQQPVRQTVQDARRTPARRPLITVYSNSPSTMRAVTNRIEMMALHIERSLMEMRTNQRDTAGPRARQPPRGRVVTARLRNRNLASVSSSNRVSSTGNRQHPGPATSPQESRWRNRATSSSSSLNLPQVSEMASDLQHGQSEDRIDATYCIQFHQDGTEW